MSFTPGTNAVFELAKTEGASQTMYDISDALSDAGLDQSVDTDDVTSLGDTAKGYLATLADGTISIDGHFTATTNKVVDVLGAVTRKTVEFAYSPEGKANTKVKLSGFCILTSKSIGASVGGRVTVSASFQITGGVTEGVWSGL